MQERFGRYTLIRRLAVGGMAEIFLAALHGDAGFEKKVVVKRILPHLSADEAFVEMFIDEAIVAAQLSHPNIIQTYDFGCEAGSHYIAMEYVEGVDLHFLLRQVIATGQRLRPAEVAALGERLARGLSYTHNLSNDAGQPRCIVHRDISPHNVMISFAGEVKVMDFGIAKAAARTTQTATGTIKGKLAYMSPEQAAGESATKLSDQFALGVVLWECLSGERLFLSDSEVQLIQRVKACDVVPLRLVRPDIPAALEAIVMRALHRNPAARYPDLEQMHDDLVAFRYSLGSAGIVHLGPLARTCPKKGDGDDSWSWATVEPPAVTRPLRAPPRLLSAGPGDQDATVSLAASMVLAPAQAPAVSVHPGHLALRRSKSPTVDVALVAQPAQAVPQNLASLAVRNSDKLLHASLPRHHAHAPRRPHRSLRPHVSQPTAQWPRWLFGLGCAALVVGAMGLIWHHGSEANMAAAPRGLSLRPHKPIATGRLSLSAEGMAMDVYLGKNCLGTTPLANESVPAGHLALRLVNEDAGVTRCFEIDVPAGGSARGLVTALGPQAPLVPLPPAAVSHGAAGKPVPSAI